MALEGLQIAQQGARDIANVRQKRRDQEVVEAKYRDDKTEKQRVRAAQEEIGAAFGGTIEGKTELGQVQSLGLSSGLLETAAALDPWMKMSKEQKTFWLVNEAERTKDPVMREAANKAMKTMNRVNYAESYSEALGRLAAEQIYKDKNAKADGSNYVDVQLDNAAIMKAVYAEYPEGRMVLIPDSSPKEMQGVRVPNLSRPIEIDLSKPVYQQLEDIAAKPGEEPYIPGNKVTSFLFDPEITQKDVDLAYRAAQSSMYKTLKEKALPAANSVYANPMAEGFANQGAQMLGDRWMHGGAESVLFEPKTLDASGMTKPGKHKEFITMKIDKTLFGVPSNSMSIPQVPITTPFINNESLSEAEKRTEAWLQSQQKITNKALNTFNKSQTGEE